MAFERHWLEFTVTARASNRLSTVVNIFELLKDHFRNFKRKLLLPKSLVLGLEILHSL
jgi:hypothetical protein